MSKDPSNKVFPPNSLEWLFTRVHHAVVLKTTLFFEGLLANGAHMRFLVRVLLVVPLVVQPLQAVVKPLGTVLAHIGQLTAMLDPHVQIEHVLG